MSREAVAATNDCCRRFAASLAFGITDPWAYAHGYMLPPLGGYQDRHLKRTFRSSSK